MFQIKKLFQICHHPIYYPVKYNGVSEADVSKQHFYLEVRDVE